MSLTTHLVDANLTAYGRGDAEGLASTLSGDCQIGPLAGEALASGRDACQLVYEKTMAAYPLGLTRSLNRIAVGPVVIDHEASQRIDGVRCYVATFYTVKDAAIGRIETVISDTQAMGLNAIQAQLDAYNVQDLDAHMALYQPDATIRDWHGAITHAGVEAIRARYSEVFAEHPKNHAQLVNRIAVGPVVVDHERIRRNPDGAAFEMAAVYTLRDGLIARIDFIR
jgi:hypothetical protein